MSDQNLKSSGTSKGLLNRGLAVVVILVALAILLVTTLTACNLPSLKKPAGPSIITSILSPQMGDVVGINQPIEISATSACNDGVIRLEFYVDGVPVATQNTTLPGGSNPLFISSIWTPQAGGQHVLMARGYTKDNRYSDSSVVFVSVNAQPAPRALNVDTILRPEGAPLPSLNDLADKTGVAVSELVNANPALSGTDPKAPLPPGTTLIFPPAPPVLTAAAVGVPSATATSTPTAGTASGAAAPGGPSGLTVAADCNSAQLSWNDNPDEEQYVVYRISPGSTSLSPITTLAANTTSYRDSLPGPGAYFYQVASRRGEQESLSQMVTAETLNTCPAPTQPPTTTSLALTVVDLQTTEPFEEAYCYVVTAHEGSDRIPLGSNFHPDAGNPRLYSFTAVPLMVLNYVAYPLNQPLNVFVHCYGVVGNYTPSLGYFSIDRRQSDWDGRILTDSTTNGEQGNFTLRYCLSATPTVPCRGVSYGSWTPGGIAPVQIWTDGPAPYNLRLRHDLRQLQWDWREQPPEFSAADLIGFHVTLARQSILTREEFPRLEYDVLQNSDGTVPRFIDDHVDPSDCSMFYAYIVEAVFRGGRRSPPSLGLSFTTAPCFLPVDVTVRFESITIDEGSTDQGDCCFPICPAAPDTTFEMEYLPIVISRLDYWHESFFSQNMQAGHTYPLSSSHDPTHVVHVTDPRQTLTIKMDAADNDPPCIGTYWANPNFGLGSCITWELPARSTEQWRRTHLHLVGGCDDPEDNAGYIFSVYVDGPQW